MKTHTCPNCQTIIECIDDVKVNVDDLKTIANYYDQHIHPLRRKNAKIHLSKKAIQKIAARLKEFSKDQLIAAMTKFSLDPWRMANNSREGIDWFFNSESRIEKFLNLEVKGNVPGATEIIVGSLIFNSLEEVKEAEKNGKIYYAEGAYHEKVN